MSKSKVVDFSKTNQTMNKSSGSNNRDKESPRKIARKKRTSRIITITILVTILAVICAIISGRTLFVTRGVEVKGSEKYTQQEIIDYAQVPMNENIFSIDINLLEEKLFEDYTYIDEAKVKISLPDTITIIITDAYPTYYTITKKEDIDKFDVYSKNFKLLTEQGIKPSELLGIDADTEDEEIFDIVSKMIKIIDNKEYEKITHIWVNSKNDMGFLYDERIEVEFGTILDIDYKFKMAMNLLEKELSEKDIGTLDCSNASKWGIFTPKD